MAKDKLTEYSATNASNDVIGDISVAEGMLPSAVNNALREQMTHLKNFSDGTDGIDVLSLADDDASAAIKIQAPSAVTTTTTLTLPDGDGDAGAMLQTNGSGQLAWSTAYRNKNLVTNGAMAISQRGSSVSVGSGTYTLDRWRTDRDGTVTATVSQQSFTLGQTDVPNEPEHYLRFDITAASGSSYVNLAQFIEGVRNGAGQAVTLSFWAKASSAQTIGLRAIQDFGSSGSSDVSQTISSISATTSWQQFTRTFTLASISGKSIGGGNDSLRILWDLPVNTVMQLDLTQVQLEVGEQATPFEHRSYGDELAACQRFFTRVPTIDGSTAYTFIATGMAINGTESIFPVSFPVTMRANPSLATSGSMRVYNGGTVNPSAGITLNSVSTYAASVTVPTGNVHTAKDALLVGANNDADANFQFDAEL